MTGLMARAPPQRQPISAFGSKSLGGPGPRLGLPLRVVLQRRRARADNTRFPAVLRCQCTENRRPQCANPSTLRRFERPIRIWQNRQSQAMVCHPRIPILRPNARSKRRTRKQRRNRSSWVPERLLARQPALQSGRQWPDPWAWWWAERLVRSPERSAVRRLGRYASQRKTKARKRERGCCLHDDFVRR